MNEETLFDGNICTPLESEKRRRVNLLRFEDKYRKTLREQFISSAQHGFSRDITNKFWLIVKKKLSQLCTLLSERNHCSLHIARIILFMIFSGMILSSLIVSNTKSYKSSYGGNPYSVYNRPYHEPETQIQSQRIFTNLRTEDNATDLDTLDPSPIEIPNSLQHIADLNNLPFDQNDIPFFFHIPRSGGSTIKDIMGSCLGLVGASDVGSRTNELGENLKIVSTKEGSRFVNVDTTTSQGIKRAEGLKLVQSGLADYIVTQHLHLAAGLFTEKYKGRLFTIMRDPIERAISLFHYLSVADWEPTYDPSLATMSIEMYARSDDRIEYNWMTRFLSNQIEGDLTQEHLLIAKETLRRKCLIGFLEVKGESMMRFEKYFNWKSNGSRSRECVERILDWGWSNKNSHPPIDVSSEAYKLLQMKNEFDLELYEYAKQLFSEQESLFENNNN